MSATEKMPEVTPELVSEDVEVVLCVTAADRDGYAFVTAHNDEAAARQMLNGRGEFQRCATFVRVRVPRSLLRERWIA